MCLLRLQCHVKYMHIEIHLAFLHEFPHVGNEFHISHTSDSAPTKTILAGKEFDTLTYDYI